jgi:ribosome assembly protein RRB1
MDIPPQLMFLHQGQKNMKELRFHPQFRTLLFSTAEDSFNVFRPNLDPDFEEEEQKQPEGEGASKMKGADFALDSEEDQEELDRRIVRTARELNK